MNEDIRLKAYYIWLQRKRNQDINADNAKENWRRAEREIAKDIIQRGVVGE